MAGAAFSCGLGRYLLAALVVIADRVTKIIIQHKMSPIDAVPVIPGWLRIIHTENPGAAFGMLADGNPWLRSGILIGVSGLVLVFVASALWSERSSFTGALTRTALALILGGAIGNLYDRVIYGTVTDFIEVYRGAWSFPAFNVADSAITVGAILLMIYLARPKRRPSGRAGRIGAKAVEMLPKLIQIGSFYIPTYGVLVALGFLAGLAVTTRLARRMRLPADQIANLVIYCAIAGIAGAKLFMFLFDLPDYFRDPGQIFTHGDPAGGGRFPWRLHRGAALSPSGTCASTHYRF